MIQCFFRGKFLSTPSSRRATVQHQLHHEAGTISIHALLAEGDAGKSYGYWRLDISIHALLAEGDPVSVSNSPNSTIISIHALLAEGDLLHDKSCPPLQIAIHALLAEGDR